ncbi:alpha-galactosidase [Xylanimonas sp. McL0601]|uniref:alpha-galactosidase n=1 Tax=Xylanimonas sp. McL0601 TaxID=3414739 RepID=UPI003CE91663
MSLVLDARDGLPVVQHWGADLGDLPGDQLEELVRANRRQVVSDTPNEGSVASVLPEQSRSYLGTPGIEGHRSGASFSPRFEVVDVELGVPDDVDGTRVSLSAVDDDAALALRLVVELLGSGLVRLRAQLTNVGDTAYSLQGLTPMLPVPLRAAELADFTGRHLKERTEQRAPFTIGTHVRQSRRGRPGADASLLVIAGEQSFTSRRGEVWGVHPAWSGNHRIVAERMPTGDSLLGAGELLLPGEIELAPGHGYKSPWTYASYGVGLDELAGRFHEHLRSRPTHPSSPRPVTLNVWEAVYFDHDAAKLARLADLAASVGVERFVLDDGWFLGRRDDTAGLGDWTVDPAVWPHGLHPLVDHVERLGMQFGLWVEPEMVNPDSDLARAHPEWILSPGTRQPPLYRNQQVLDLAHPEAWGHVLVQLDALVREYGLRYLKWDHNRDLIEPAHQPTGRAGVHAQTLAVYRLIDALKARHPGLEIESCSSGGCRVDLGILERTDRIWTSDCIDAVERTQIQRGTELLVPPELMGAHVGSTVNHSTGRALSVTFRATTAFGYHFGIEWDLTQANDVELAELRTWVALHKEHRALLHTGRVVHSDHPDPAVVLRGVIAPDGREAIYSLATLAASVWAPPGRITLPGLDPATSYTVATLAPADVTRGSFAAGPVAWSTSPLVVSGAVLGRAGLQIPAIFPEQAVLIRCTAL